MSLKESQVDKMWNKLGFTVTHASDHVRAVLEVDGRVIARTKRSHGRGKLDGRVPELIRQQMRLSSPQFKLAVDCPLQRDQYLIILRDKGELT